MIKVNIDMPKNCGKCPFFQRLICSYGNCLIDKDIKVYWSLNRDKKCKLIDCQ